MRNIFNYLSLAGAVADDFLSAPLRFSDSMAKRFSEDDSDIFATPLVARAFAIVMEAPILLVQGQAGMTLTQLMTVNRPALMAGWLAGMLLLTPLSMKICEVVLNFGDLVFDGSEEEKNTVPMEAFPSFNKTLADMRPR